MSWVILEPIWSFKAIWASFSFHLRTRSFMATHIRWFTFRISSFAMVAIDWSVGVLSFYSTSSICQRFWRENSLNWAWITFISYIIGRELVAPSCGCRRDLIFVSYTFLITLRSLKIVLRDITSFIICNDIEWISRVSPLRELVKISSLIWRRVHTVFNWPFCLIIVLELVNICIIGCRNFFWEIRVIMGLTANRSSDIIVLERWKFARVLNSILSIFDIRHHPRVVKDLVSIISILIEVNFRWYVFYFYCFILLN